MKKALKYLPFLLFLYSCATAPELPREVVLLPPDKPPALAPSPVSGVDMLIMDYPELATGGAALFIENRDLEYVLTAEDPDREGEVLSAKTSGFAQKNQIHIAVNGSPFDPVDYFNRSGRSVDIIGIYGTAGNKLSDAHPQYDAFFVLPDGSVLFDSQANIPPRYKVAVGGFHMVLKDGDVLGGQGARHPRTLIGVSEDGQTLILAVFDGRQKNRAGLTLQEACHWMAWLGASSALNLDGGGSSTIILKQVDGTVQVLNKPIHMGIPGLERAVGNHLGIRVPANPES